MFASMFSLDAQYAASENDTIARYRDYEIRRVGCDTVDVYRDGRKTGRAWCNGVVMVYATCAGPVIHADWLDQCIDAAERAA